MDQNYYTILGISPAATPREIKLAYKKLALQYHPDKNLGNVQAEEKFKIINTAYQTLSDPTKRLRYDLNLQYISEQRRVQQQQQAYYNPRYRHTREPASVSERYYRTRPAVQEQRFSRHDLYITVSFIAAICVFCILLKVVMDYVAGEDNYKTALTYIADGKYSSAHSLLTDAIHFRPKHADSYLTRASIELNIFEDYEAALQDLNQAIALEEEVPAETFYMRGKCYMKLAKFDLAEQDFTQALEMDSSMYAAYLERGELRLFYKHDFNKAIADFSSFLKHAKSGESWSKALTFRGFGYYKTGNYEQAKQDYERVLQTDKSNGRVYYLLGRNELEQEQREQACNHFYDAYRLGYTAALLELRANCQ